jgi:hypothetical protein
MRSACSQACEAISGRWVTNTNTHSLFMQVREGVTQACRGTGSSKSSLTSEMQRTVRGMWMAGWRARRWVDWASLPGPHWLRVPVTRGASTVSIDAFELTTKRTRNGGDKGEEAARRSRSCWVRAHMSVVTQTTYKRAAAGREGPMSGDGGRRGQSVTWERERRRQAGARTSEATCS